MIDLFVDVDGVVLPVVDVDLGPDVECSGWDDWERIDGNMWWHSPGLVAALRGISEHPDVQAHWCTTWGPRARDALAPAIGLPEWSVLDEDRRWLRRESVDRKFSDWWKRDAVQEAAIEGRQVVWIDDDLRSDPLAIPWIQSIGGLWICPVTTVGLARRDVDLIASLLT